jgi:hypothetical protein
MPHPSAENSEILTFDALRRRLGRPGTHSAEILRNSIQSGEGRFSLESLQPEEVVELMEILDNVIAIHFQVV